MIAAPSRRQHSGALRTPCANRRLSSRVSPHGFTISLLFCEIQRTAGRKAIDIRSRPAISTSIMPPGRTQEKNYSALGFILAMSIARRSTEV
jgi:hypothetical protein